MDRKILIVCSLGMSTSLLVRSMRNSSNQVFQYQIKCSDVTNALQIIKNFDIIVLAPHIRFMEKEFQLKCQTLHKPYYIINEQDYHEFNGLHILEMIEEQLLAYEKNYPFTVILLHYNGMMSNLMYLDMQQKQKKLSLDWVIKSCHIDYFDIQNHYADLLLLEPQIKYEMNKMKQSLPSGISTIIMCPPHSLYASFNGEKMIEYIQQNYKYEIQKRNGEIENENNYESR